MPHELTADRVLYLAALVAFLVAVPPLPIRINLVALGLALATIAWAF